MTAFPTGLDLDDDTAARLQRIAAARRCPAQVLAREAIVQYVEREERRRGFHEDALAAWASYRADGLHVTEQEADAWLARLEAGEEAPPPEPHA